MFNEQSLSFDDDTMLLSIRSPKKAPVPSLHLQLTHSFPHRSHYNHIIITHTLQLLIAFKTPYQLNHKKIMMVSSEVSFPDRCMLYNGTLGLPNPKGIIERPALLPFGFIFGDDCVQDRFSYGAGSYDVTNQRRCTHCNQGLWYRSCKHTVVPHKINLCAFGIFSSSEEDVPQVTTAAEMPENCPECAEVVLAKPSAKQLGPLNAQRQNLLSYRDMQGVTRAQAKKIDADLAACDEEIERVQAAAALLSLQAKAARRGW